MFAQQTLCVLIAALGTVDVGQIFAAHCYMRVVGAKGLLGNREGPQIERLGLCIASLRIVKGRQVVKRNSCLRMLGAKSLFDNRECPVVQLPRNDPVLDRFPPSH